MRTTSFKYGAYPKEFTRTKYGTSTKYGELFVYPLPLDEQTLGCTIFKQDRAPSEAQLRLGEVVAIVQELVDTNDKVHKLGLEVGDIVLFRGRGIELVFEDQDAMQLKGSYILGIIKQTINNKEGND